MGAKHAKVHLLIISETGKVKSRKISIRFLKRFLLVLLLILLTTSTFTYLYLRDFLGRRTIEKTASELQKVGEELRTKLDEKNLEISRLSDVVMRLKTENLELKKHLLSKNQAKKTLPKENANKDAVAFQKFLRTISRTASLSSVTIFHIRDPKIIVSSNETRISFKLYKDSLKRVYGRYLLLGVFRPEDPKMAGEVVAFPPRGIANFKIRPGYGRFFKIERRFLTIEATLPHPEGVKRFSEFHVFVFGRKNELLFHEKFEAP